MSLYVGHLSPHIRQEDLERVFWRFGRCSVQLKDGYGFAVYEATADAERALRALRGKPICGEQISLNWSNRQPRPPFQRFARTTRFNEAFHRRSLREENDEVGIRGSNNRGGFCARTFRPSMYNHDRQSLDDALAKKRGQIIEDTINIEGDKGVNLEGVMNEGGTSDFDQVENDRWGDPGTDTLNINGMDNGDEFDRYEPYHGYNKRDEDENIQLDSPYSSMNRGISQEKRRRENTIDATDRKLDMPKSQQTCYKCGQVGHIMRNCPKTDARREKFSKFNRKREEANAREEGRRLKRFRQNSWGSPDGSRDPMVPRTHKRDKKDSYSGEARRLAQEGKRSLESRERHQPKLREDSLYKKRRRLKHGSMKKKVKKGRYRKHCTPSSSQSPPRSSSRSSRFDSDDSSSRLRSTSSRSHSASSNSRSSSYSKSVSSRSRSMSRSQSKSRSRSRSLTFSVSPGQKVTPSPKNKQIDHSTEASPVGNVRNVTSPKFKQLESTKAKDTCVMLGDENPSTSFKVDSEANEDHPGYNVVDAEYPAFRFDYSEKDLSSDLSKYDIAARENHEQDNGQHEAPPFELERQTSTVHESSSSTRLTTEEMFLALKHYGLGAPEEGQTGFTVEEYFGAARLWPWEMIYYRRLKKGPISTENYAKRLEQNREFGIVDKYIRSSSGWGEHNQENT